jgi:non-ribosomal peptide synthetase component E (peptide arylation enzyme)
MTLELAPEGLPIFPSTRWQLLEARAQETSDRVILEDEVGRSLTAKQWLESAASVAAGLHHQGVKEGTPVSWQLPTTLEIVDALPRNAMGKILKQDLRKTFG